MKKVALLVVLFLAGCASTPEPYFFVCDSNKAQKMLKIKAGDDFGLIKSTCSSGVSSGETLMLVTIQEAEMAKSLGTKCIMHKSVDRKSDGMKFWEAYFIDCK